MIDITLKDANGVEIESYQAYETPRKGDYIYLQYHSFKVWMVERWHNIEDDKMKHHSGVYLDCNIKDL